ncbi:unnamed protein product [Kluyveromyces dobzhanskii CBS 2104]|uniref:WGS project CCBQ000000000 data, contig 00017 n=1 Tax=Kluyveromyces dobzhanskii CBS 2104 TaxID=1427455 RepID=A0A0A8L6L3_9SACH|nr:unnamed protein product [Kluyveromyces dobzhanskii CBS 2104]
MDPKVFNCSDKDRFQMLHASSDLEHERDHTFLKVTPTLFTQDKLPLFDSLDLYTSLIKCSKFMEQGERLHNLSWRIINKSLLKDQDINKSKRRDGVRNLYNVINPIKQTHSFPQLQQQLQKPKNSSPRSSSPRSASTVVAPAATKPTASPHVTLLSPVSNQSSIQKPTANTHTVTTRKLIPSQPTSPEPTSSEPILKKLETPARSLTNTPDLRKDLAKKKFPLVPELVHGSKHQHQQSSVSNNLPLSETKSNAHSQTSLFSRNPSSKSLFAKNLPTPFTPANCSTTSSANGSAENLKSGDSNRNSKSHAYVNGTRNGAAGAANDSTHAHNNGHDHKNLFFSSEDEESDWDSLSDDSDIYDEDEDNDQYYEDQWDNLMFSKTHHNQNLHHVLPKESGEKKSLLSGLFMQEKQVKTHSKQSDNSRNASRESVSKSPVELHESATASVKASGKPYNRPLEKQSEKPVEKRPPNGSLHSNPTEIQITSHPVAPETSDLVAVGSVTPSSSWQNNGLSDYHKIPIPTGFERSKRLGSFSSIVSESTKERYYHESNAPPAAQTILPTALSTHMFLPNNVHQQRMALRGGDTPLEFNVEAAKAASRRQSMDIPSKNRSNFFLKTRMEISEEESFARTYARCVKK